MFSLVRGHWFTVAPVAELMLRPPPLPPSEPWTADLADPDRGVIRLTGAFHPGNIARANSGDDREPCERLSDARACARTELAPGNTDAAIIAVHGLGGDIDSHYIRRAAAAAGAAGMACLRLNLRGADMSGHDIYHAGLTVDVRAAIASPALARYRRIGLVGYSIGGHIVLRYATEDIDPRVHAVAAVCPPLDLALAARDIDQRARWPYRRYVLATLKRMLTAIELAAIERGGPGLPLPLGEALRITELRRWDSALVVPRFRFSDSAQYYRTMSVGNRLDALAVPALVVAARHDPMVLAASIERALAGRRPPRLTLRWLDPGGHVGFPASASLGEPAPLGLEHQLCAWLARQ